MLRYARLALLAGLAGSIPVVVALDPPPQRQTQKSERPGTTKKGEPARQSAPAKDDASKESGGRINRRNTRMQERDREIDRMVNKPKK
jgi:hypothetical protein